MKMLVNVQSFNLVNEQLDGCFALEFVFQVRLGRERLLLLEKGFDLVGGGLCGAVELLGGNRLPSGFFSR